MEKYVAHVHFEKTRKYGIADDDEVTMKSLVTMMGLEMMVFYFGE